MNGVSCMVSHSFPSYSQLSTVYNQLSCDASIKTKDKLFLTSFNYYKH